MIKTRSIFMRTLENTITCAALLAIALAGCGTTSKEIHSKSQSQRTDVFVEIKSGETLPKGFAKLLMKANIKTPLAGYYISESKASLHGKPGYPFLVNIDGQAVLWKVDGVTESRPAYDNDSKTSHDPEAKEGMKYVLEKSVRLRAGQHRIFLGLPEENYSTSVDIVLKDGEEALLEYKPIYRYKTFPVRMPTFLKGIDRYEVFLNGKQIRQY
jgi:hypothetical protein